LAYSYKKSRSFAAWNPCGRAHIHEDSDDIIYVVKGKAKMWIDQVGDIQTEAGTFVGILKKIVHQPHDIEEDFIGYDVFYPYLA
jgi:uncharacterized RmlC-like cupin family protein